MRAIFTYFIVEIFANELEYAMCYGIEKSEDKDNIFLFEEFVESGELPVRIVPISNVRSITKFEKIDKVKLESDITKSFFNEYF